MYAHTALELAIAYTITAALIGLALLVRKRMRPGTPAGVVVVSAGIVSIVIGWLVLSRMRDARERDRRDRSVDSALHASCKGPSPAEPNLAAMHELMCAPGVRYATLRLPDGEVDVSAHNDLLGTAIPRLPPGKTYVVVAVDSAGATVATYAVDPKAPFSFTRDPRATSATKVRLLADGAQVAEQPLAP